MTRIAKLLAVLSLSIIFIITTASLSAPAEVKNPDTLIIATIGEPETLDPAWAYDTASAEVIFNVYETLLFFDGSHTDKFVPMLATEVPSFENGLIRDGGLTIIFPIRKGVKFHNGNPLTPEDVEYSLERVMVMDRDGGPSWMILEALLGVPSTRDEKGNIVVPFEDIDKAVEVEGDKVILRLKKPFPITTLFQILSQSWSSIVDKEWAVAQGCWPGTAETYEEYNNPEVPCLQEKMMGTGPFMLERWEHGREIVLVRNDNYWREPAKLKRVIIKKVDEWATRKLMFLAGDADIVYVPRPHYKELEGVPGIKVIKDLPTLAVTALFFQFEINPNSSYIGSGKLDGKGIPPDFFKDKYVRLAFAHAIDWKKYIEEVFYGEAIQPACPIIKGLPCYSPEFPKYEFNLTKAKEYFMKAWNGTVWEKGFYLELLYNVGNVERRTAAYMIKENIESLNPKFKIYVRAVEWPKYLKEMVKGMLPIFIIGWLADYPDPHNFVHPFMHSRGTFAAWQHYKNPVVDELIEKALRTPELEERCKIYVKLAQIYYEDVPSVPLYQALGRVYMRDWVQGWYYNPIFPGYYCYPIWKGYP